MTKVEEWTRADTGVGAAIAIGSQGEKGNWALLVIAARRVAIKRGREGGRKGILQWAEDRVIPIPRSRAISPMRLVKAVIIPAPRVEGVW